ncbi:hydrolase CocE/NonD family protein [Eremomyces bilateralis CBS 781.70]|uniref:Hydrolase CocE/NonD family protein n=1 Tax=Eremomyces bilateralis CBS 781.70 TaxID=1392243 RepID=A0A6G1G3D7_9PEZI|nr:hydrolase CocE/NonD family protein [Eremomyces bilateralis CBS 781.70]KAF1812563.1 hydrolase CocE/NonD family protein [Eremomyces bilateralis CBS 781.70]
MDKIGEIDIILKESPSTTQGHALYLGFKQETELLTKGSILKDGALALPCDILWEKDVELRLRDGTTIYTDVFRPPNGGKIIPAIISSAGFGKQGGLNRMGTDRAPWRNGIPQKTVSSLEKFEALDPAYWCLHGYALVHPDTRGTWMSEGDVYINSTLDGKDGYDIVEWIAEQPWSNKRVTMAGNSYLAQTQWWVGAESPPHLTCLAPWEGWNDLYNDTVQRGGIPDAEFQQNLLDNCFVGLGRTEDVSAMTAKYPTWNDYWEDRRAKVENIKIPLYVVASWTNMLHTRGTFRGWSESSSPKKWLRVHNSHEWPDLYYPQNVEDLRKFYDHFMKDKSNGWEFTPKVRLSILNPGNQDIVNRPELEFPLTRQQSIPLYLNASTSCLEWGNKPTNPDTVNLDSRKDIAKFTYTFPCKAELTGYFKLKLWVQAIGNDDIDLFTKFSKLDANGGLVETECVDVGYLQDNPEVAKEKLREMHAAGDPRVNVFFSEGAHGRLRVSHRELDIERSTPHQPHYTHRNIQTLKSEGEIVPVEIEMWPHGMIWERGEKMQLSVAGFNLRPELLPWVDAPKTLNNGRILIHAGGEYDSLLLVPFIPQG